MVTTKETDMAKKNPTVTTVQLKGGPLAGKQFSVHVTKATLDLPVEGGAYVVNEARDAATFKADRKPAGGEQ